MNNILFACDIDNTIIHSYRHLTKGDVCVEHLNNQKQGYMYKNTYENLSDALKGIVFLPITTRTIEQYRRIIWPTNCRPDYAIVSNGANLIYKNIPNKEWKTESELTVKQYDEDYKAISEILLKEDIRSSDMADNMFLRIYCHSHLDAKHLFEIINPKTELELMVDGRKLYCFCPKINKGTALVKAKLLFNQTITVCAGDSINDLQMLNCSDIAIIPNNSLQQFVTTQKLVCPKSKHFSDYIIEKLFEIKNNNYNSNN